jgi:hypothetical protein
LQKGWGRNGVRATWPSAQARRHAAPALSGHSANDVVDSRRVIIIGPVVSVWVKDRTLVEASYSGFMPMLNVSCQLGRIVQHAASENVRCRRETTEVEIVGHTRG